MAFGKKYESSKQSEFINDDEAKHTPDSVGAWDAKQIEGYLDKITYNKGTWCILSIKTKNHQGHDILFRCIGNAEERIEGAYYKFQGSFKNDKYNQNKKSFYFTKYEVAYNNDERGIITYIALEIPGIGEAGAKKLYSVFGAQTLIRMGDAEALLNVLPRLTERQAREISDQINRNTNLKDLKRRLYGIGLTPGLVNRLILHYGEDKNIESIVRKDCFGLTEIAGIGFSTVSKIATLLGIPKNDNGRIKAAVVYAIEELETSEGHSCVTKEDLISKTSKLLGFFHDSIEEQIAIASQNGYLMQYGRSYSIQYLLEQESKNEQPATEPESSTTEITGVGSREEQEVNDLLRAARYNPTATRTKARKSYAPRKPEPDDTLREPDSPMSGSEDWDISF